jgi:hypothetical protein
MSDELYFVVDLVSFLLAAVILAFGAARALKFRRVLVSDVFRSRALWTSVLLFLWIVPNDTELLGYSASSSSLSVPGLGVLFIPTLVIALALVIAIVAFIDFNMRVGKELDFFHRDSLQWERLRPIVYVVAPVTLLIGVPNGGTLALIGTLGLPLALGYAALAQLVNGLRVREGLMRIFLRYSGAGLLILVVGTILIPSPGPPFGVVYDAFLLVGCYLLYLSSRSLAPLDHIEDDVGAANREGESAVVQPGRS